MRKNHPRNQVNRAANLPIIALTAIGVAAVSIGISVAIPLTAKAEGDACSAQFAVKRGRLKRTLKSFESGEGPHNQESLDWRQMKLSLGDQPVYRYDYNQWTYVGTLKNLPDLMRDRPYLHEVAYIVKLPNGKFRYVELRKNGTDSAGEDGRNRLSGLQKIDLDTNENLRSKIQYSTQSNRRLSQAEANSQMYAGETLLGELNGQTFLVFDSGPRPITPDNYGPGWVDPDGTGNYIDGLSGQPMPGHVWRALRQKGLL